jgi:hypothetical protein
MQAKNITTWAVLLNENNTVSSLEDGVQGSKSLESKIDATTRLGLLSSYMFGFQLIMDSFLKSSRQCKELSLSPNTSSHLGLIKGAFSIGFASF